MAAKLTTALTKPASDAPTAVATPKDLAPAPVEAPAKPVEMTGTDGKQYDMTKQTDGSYRMNGFYGDIYNAERQAIAFAKQEKTNINFEFNGVELTGTPTTKSGEIALAFTSKLAAQREAYLKSPEYAADQAAAQQRRAEATAQADAVVKTLPDAIKGGDESVLKWFGKLGDPAEAGGLSASSRQEVLSQLRAAGYKEHEYTGADYAENDRRIDARHIIGQSMDALDGGPVHLITGAVEDHFARFGDASAPTGDTKTAANLTPDQAIARAKQSPEFTSPSTRPDVSTLSYDSANAEAVNNMLKLADAGRLTGYGKDSDYSMMNQVNLVNKTLQDLADAAKNGGPALTPALIDRVMDDTDKLGHSGASFAFLQDMSAATAREDVGRAIYKAIQKSSPSLKDMTYEEYVGGFDKAFGGGASIAVAKNEAYDSVANRALEQAKESGKRVSFKFNGTDVTVAPGSKLEDVNSTYTRGYKHVQAQKGLDRQVADIAEATHVRDLGFGDGHVVQALCENCRNGGCRSELKTRFGQGSGRPVRCWLSKTEHRHAFHQCDWRAASKRSSSCSPQSTQGKR